MGLFSLLFGRRCYICGNPIRRKYYPWKIKGRRRILCPNCNQSMERDVSKKKMAAFKGKSKQKIDTNVVKELEKTKEELQKVKLMLEEQKKLEEQRRIDAEKEREEQARIDAEKQKEEAARKKQVDDVSDLAEDYLKKLKKK